jgi:hypothetical protein
VTPTKLDGSMTLDTRACSGGAFFDGPIQWQRTNSAVVSGKAGGSLDGLASALKKARGGDQ